MNVIEIFLINNKQINNLQQLNKSCWKL